MPDTILHKLVREAPDLASSTKTTFLSDLDAWVAFAGEDPAGWTRARAQEFYSSLLGRMKAQSANRLMATLTYAAGWWAKREHNDRLDFSVIQKAPPEETEGKDAITEEQAQQLLAAASRASLPPQIRALQTPWILRDTALVTVGLETGMRRMSLADMAIERTGIGKGGYPMTRVRLKGQRAPARYEVPLSEAAQAALEPWLAYLAQHDITKGAIWRRFSHRIRDAKSAKIGGGLTTQSVYDIVTKLGAEAGIENMTPHIFRHTFITWRLFAGWTPQQVAAVTGHQLPRRSFTMPDADIGAMNNYVDPKMFAPRVSTATPAWLQPKRK